MHRRQRGGGGKDSPLAAAGANWRFATASMPVSSHQQLALVAGEQPCTAEWCPDAAAASLLAVGTYQLDEVSQMRLGKLLMYRLAAPDGDSSEPPPPPQLAPLSSLDLPGIFDLRWHPRSAMPQLAAALADGSVRLLAFAEGLAGGGGSGSSGKKKKSNALVALFIRLLSPHCSFGSRQMVHLDITYAMRYRK